VACNAYSPGSLLSALSTALDGSINVIWAMVRNALASHWLSEFVIAIALFLPFASVAGKAHSRLIASKL
jgi:hypothetical protein